ncbi:1-acyl-sn-glycerol-3-phosphate acyltransferase [Haematospirillum sp. H1815]|uniref:lysophospholipid acyltransferase family protein n=1 Tax=Haematospirillum sp. H1815 TaxID=2723108 RepID=UPI00143CA4A5|nr:lysophospholipid acyltransferase family protein [Haematospirillum sp. H1815]NKD77738.1 1-acyl-sn-glycerol-3-phosphate acyltransferase [Haematospirillum sp. H1815]
MLTTIGTATKLALYVLWTGLCLIAYIPALLLRYRYRNISMLYWKVALSLIFGVKVVVRGTLSQHRPLLCVANHVSYIDIMILCALIPGAFVSKAEVRQWPGIGFLASIARTIFVERRVSATAQHRDVIAERLQEGEPIILFPEGTSSDGNRVLPFKSSLFNTAEKAVNGEAVHVQPVSIAYTRYKGLPMGRSMRPFFAWYGDMELFPHLMDFLRLGSLTVEVDFFPTVTIAETGNRKTLSRHCEVIVRNGLNAALSGNRPEQE